MKADAKGNAACQEKQMKRECGDGDMPKKLDEKGMVRAKQTR
jgi:hypothetical protein